MVDFAVDVEVEGSPDDGKVVDLDERVVDALLDLGFAGLAYAVGEGFDGHLGGLAVAHEDHRRAGDPRQLDSGCVACGHACEHGVDGGQEGVFVGCGGVQRGGCCADASEGYGEREQRHSEGDFHRDNCRLVGEVGGDLWGWITVGGLPGATGGYSASAVFNPDADAHLWGGKSRKRRTASQSCHRGYVQN